MELPLELESTLLAGHLVNFVYLDPNGNESKDKQFMARCHFLPSVGDKVTVAGNQQDAYVKNIYHSFLENEKFEKGIFLQMVNVVLTSKDSFSQPNDLH